MSAAPLIVGAGLAGLIAAHAWPRSAVIEAMPEPVEGHKALLRFRSDAVARATGIPFRQVRVRKGIYDGSKFVEPSIRTANLYEGKCFGYNGLHGERSIWNIAPVERFIAPEDFYMRMVAAVGSRIEWATPIVDLHGECPIVSTMPLPAMVKLAGLDDLNHVSFKRAAITSARFRFEGVDLFQTIYFVDPSTKVYRASFTGSLLIVELADFDRDHISSDDMQHVMSAFGIEGMAFESRGIVKQKFGKIAEIDDAARKAAMFRLTHEHNVYSLGRFATWRNILLDDVVKDIESIKGQMQTKSAYDSWRSNAS